ncbi:unnamed protein product [Caenorhabditis nigoni]
MRRLSLALIVFCISRSTQTELHYFGDQFHCLTGFFKEAYSHNESTCFQKYDFLEEDLSKKREAFEKGKLCFTDYRFVNDISIKPNDTDGLNAHNLLKTFQFVAIGQQVLIGIEEFHNIKLESNDTRVAKVAKMCKDAQDCISDFSFIPHQIKQKLEHHCTLLEMVSHGSFLTCVSQLMEERPDVSDYECLEGLDLYNLSSCNMATTKKECVKKIMEDKCGKDAVVDCDKISERVVKLFDCE